MTQQTAVQNLTGEYTIDTGHSRLGFVARHAMVTKVRGQFREFDGRAHLDGENPANSWAEVTVQMDSIDTGNADRDAHLRTNDFFDVPNHPEMTFKSTSVERTGEDTYVMRGDLTLKGTTQPVEIEWEYTGTAKDPFGNLRAGFDGKAVINRRDFGVQWNAPLETGGVLVSDKITLELEVSAIRNQEQK